MNVTATTIRSSFRDQWTPEEAQRAVDSRSRCSLCPSFLNDPGAGFIKVFDRGAERPSLLFVGEAPGKDEARKGESFVGSAARHLDVLLKQVGVDLDQCRWANVVKCFPHKPNEDKSREPSPDEIMRCSPYLFDTIAELQPAVIMSIGAIASAALLGKDTVGTISQVSGKIFKTMIRGREYTIVPCYHPSADLQSGGRYTDKIIKAVAVAWGLVNRTEIPVTAHMLNSTQECLDYLDSLLRRYRAGEIPWVAYDLEWGSQMEAVGSKRSESERAADMALYDPNVDVNIASFATSVDEGYSLVLDHAESNVDVARVKEKLREVFAEVPVVAHNAIQAEVPWTKTRIGVELTVAHDTMFESYAYWMKTASHGLKALCFRLFGWPDWGTGPDAWFNSQPDPKKRTYKHLPLDIMRKYAPVDACGCWGANERLLPMIAEVGVQQNYNRRMALANVVAKWHERGNIIDLKEFERLRQIYPGKVDAVLQALRAVPEIQEYEKLTGNEFNPGSAPQKGEVLYGVLGAPIGEMNPKIQRRKGAPSPEVRIPVDLPKGSKEIPYPVAIATESVWLGPLAGQKGSERLDIDLNKTKELRDSVVLRKPTKFDHASPLILVHGTPKTDEDQLLKIEREAVCPTCRGEKTIPDNRTGGSRACVLCEGSGYRPGWETLGQVAYDIHRFMKIRLIISNYLEKFPFFIKPGTSQLFTNYGLHTVATARLSTMNPNLQSFPWNSDIKRLFVSKFYDEGGLYMGADYSQLEVRVLAAVSEDPLLIAAYLTCKKCQRVGTPADQGRCPSCHVKLGIDLHRQTAASIFRISEDAVTDAQRSVAKAVTFGVIYGRGARAIAEETGLSVNEADAIIKGFFTRFKRVSEYVQDMHRTCVDVGEVMSKTGTRLIFEHRAEVLEAVAMEAELKVKNAAAYRNGTKPQRLPAFLDMKLAEAKRQSQNYPIQGPGGEICIDAIILLDEIFTNRGMKSHHWETVHDSIGFDLYPTTDEILTTLWLAKEVMENRVANKHSWMTVPLVIDRVLGARWDGDVEIEDVDGDQIKVKGPKEYYEQICAQLEKAGILAKAEIIEEKLGKPAPEITQKGYAGGSGRTEKVEAVIRLVA